MDKKLTLLKASMLAYSILMIGLIVSNRIETMIGISVLAYCVLGYRKFRRNQLAAGTAS